MADELDAAALAAVNAHDDAPLDAGEAGTERTSATPSTAPAASEAARAADDTGEPGPVPYKTFAPIRTAYTRYKAHGTPDEVSAKLAKLDEYERAIAAAQEQQRQQVNQSEAGQRRASLRRELLTMLDEEIPGASEHLRSLPQRTAQADDEYDARAADLLRDVVTQSGAPIDLAADGKLDLLASLTSAIINRDPELRAAYWRPHTQRDALATAWSRLDTDLLGGASRRADAAKHAANAERRAALGSRATASASTAQLKVADYQLKARPGSAEYAREAHDAHEKLMDNVLDEVFAGGAGG